MLLPKNRVSGVVEFFLLPGKKLQRLKKIEAFWFGWAVSFGPVDVFVNLLPVTCFGTST